MRIKRQARVQKNASYGFTLAELLIVVAIIGILVAVSIPIFSSQMEKARIATDKANVRSAKAAAIADYLSTGKSDSQMYYYDAATGTVTTDETAAKAFTGYGKSSKELGTDTSTGIPNDGTAHIVSIEVSSAGTSASWVLGTSTGSGTNQGGSTQTAGITNVTDTSGEQHTLSAVSTWTQITEELNNRDKYNTSNIWFTLQPGTVFSDDEGNSYLYYGNSSSVSAAQHTTASEFLNNNKNTVMQLNNSETVLTSKDMTTRYSDTVWTHSLSAGTLCYYNGTLYVSNGSCGIFDTVTKSPGLWTKVIYK